ncbi:MAG: hypothetical protein ACTTMZ_00555 [Candidatus Karelsulcia muelleri]
MELLLMPRILRAIEEAGGLSDRQHEFRKGRSTLDAIREVIEAYQGTRESCPMARPSVMLVTLDVKSAFNSARWADNNNPIL